MIEQRLNQTHESNMALHQETRDWKVKLRLVKPEEDSYAEHRTGNMEKLPGQFWLLYRTFPAVCRVFG